MQPEECQAVPVIQSMNQIARARAAAFQYHGRVAGRGEGREGGGASQAWSGKSRPSEGSASRQPVRSSAPQWGQAKARGGMASPHWAQEAGG